MADRRQRRVTAPKRWHSIRLVVCSLIFMSAPTWARAQLSTEDHLAESPFWPTQDHATRDEFVGTDACATCHATKVSTQTATPMARTLLSPSLAEILHVHSPVSFQAGHYNYQIRTNAHESVYSVNDGSRTLSYPLAWAFGTGRVAQSYLFRLQDGGFYESRATYFVHLAKLDFTPARALTSPSSLEEAMYRPVPAAEVLRCFACHATASSIAGKLDEEHLVPGVTCEACHGPGASHAKAMDEASANKSANKPLIFNSAHLSPQDAVDFCGACHGSWWDVKLAGVKGVSTTRSAPYRLVTSKCWGTKGDPRLVCTACHDPHKQLETQASAYDRNCLSCHVNSPGAKPTSTHPGNACPKAVSNCTSCHMPKTNVPEMHSDFTDHRIRIARAGEAFPE